MSSKAKRVLPTRPEPPTVEQILADVRGTRPSDPVFVLAAEPPRGGGHDGSPLPDSPAPAKHVDAEDERERLYRQSRSYVEMNQQLQESCQLLKEKCEELRRAGATLEQDILEMRQKAF
ncbi:UPF0449 protein C19orf25 homolog [Dromaius novaehollandiae]|uniref:UPF0449 protein C19orf25 homolog n=1 Tax=Dromaius novaehollandiae TaxID=8790 RepID=UPI000E1E2D62|nr:UPF0449 protein C19orf25 homolog [Dromaius novaehollandiae]